MNRSSVLRRIVLSAGMLLSVAWFGAIQAAQEASATTQASPAADEGLFLIKSDSASVILELWTPSFEIDEIDVGGVAYHTLSAVGYGQTDEVGRPQLPLKGTLLGVPPSAEYSLRIIEVEEEIVPGSFNVYPVPQPVPRWDEEGNLDYVGLEFAKDEGVYSTNIFYPADVAEIGSSAFIRDQKVVQLRFFPFGYNPVTGELRHYRRIRVELSFDYADGRPALAAALDDGDPFDQVLQNAVLNYDSARDWRARPSATSAPGEIALGGGDPSYKVLVDEDGMYRMTYTDLQVAGIDVDNVDPRTFKLQNQGDELAIRVLGEGDGDLDSDDYILFYGQQMTTIYTETNVYWLTVGGSGGLRMPERDGTLGATTVLTYFQTTDHWEEDLYYLTKAPKPDTIPSEEPRDHWAGKFVPAYGSAASTDYVVTLAHLAVSPPGFTSTVRGSLYGGTSYDASPDHHTKVYLNGHLLDDATWDGPTEYQFEADVPETLLIEGSNTFSVECPFDLDPSVPYDLVYANWFEIDYRRTYTVENDSLLFDGDEGGNRQYEVGEFLTKTVEVFDITDPISVTRMVSTTIVGSGGYTLKFEDSISGEHHYLALTLAQYKTPLGIFQDTPSNLMATSNEADYIIITHSDFYSAVLPLKDHRAAQGLRTMVVDVQDVYDEFSYGIFDPRAIRYFLEYAYENWVGPPPTYVLLVGDGNYDFKDYKGYGEPNYVPPYLMYADEWIGETAADNRYVCLSGDDILPDMHIGRLPAQTAAQASAMVSKITDYEENPPEGDWRQEVFFLADDADDGGDFPALSDDIADSHLPPAPLYAAEKVYYGTAPYTDLTDVRDALTNAFGSGRLLVNYVGHGAAMFWGGYPPGPFLAQADVASLPASQKTPVILAMACMEGHFILPSPSGSDLSCVGESLVRAGGRGAVASWSPTSFGLSDGQHYLHEGFYDAVFWHGVHELGAATFLGRLNLYQNAGGDHRELIDTYIVFGDPALRLPVIDLHPSLFVPLALKRY